MEKAYQRTKKESAYIKKDKIIAAKGRRHSVAYHVEKPTIKANAFYFFIKRVFDIAVSMFTGIVLAIPMLIIALIIRVDSHGPAFFQQERLGKNGKPFTMYKFRTMYLDAEADGPQWAKESDCRCTRVGYVLRKSRLDELPQLLNILKGDMSLVGPRPERACFYEKFEKYIHGFHYRLMAKPGLTGLAQINGGYDLEPEEKIVYDVKYIENNSVALDLYCIFKTVKVVFTHKGAR